jgi:hypothetical protein
MTRGNGRSCFVGVVGWMVIGLFLPWRYTYHLRYSKWNDNAGRPAGYAFIANEPEPIPHPMMKGREGPVELLGAGVEIDVRRLAVQYVAFAGAIVLAVNLLGRSASYPRQTKVQHLP